MLDVSQQSHDEIRNVVSTRRTGDSCQDLDASPAIETVPDPECGDCLREGTTWVALRQCLGCGNIGCCDSSPSRHATRHFRQTQHPVMETAEPGEDWRWCYLHHLTA
jgi:CPA1 family monovalent cation:H+ antiporter